MTTLRNFASIYTECWFPLKKLNKLGDRGVLGDDLSDFPTAISGKEYISGDMVLPVDNKRAIRLIRGTQP